MKGSISLAVGPMFSGKTEWLIGQLQQEKRTGRNILPIRYSLDTRYSDTEIASHNNLNMPALGAISSDDVLKLLVDHPSTEILGIDEIQFYDPKLADVCAAAQKNSVTIYASGLDTDFMKNSWDTTEAFFQIANTVTRLMAICSICDQKNAIYTKRLSDESSQVLIGGQGLYTPRCEVHYSN